MDNIVRIAEGSGTIAMAISTTTMAFPKITFSQAQPGENRLRYLDLQILTSHGPCQVYGKANPKPLLPLWSCHPKIIKSGAIKAVPIHAIKKSSPPTWTKKGLRLTEAFLPPLSSIDRTADLSGAFWVNLGYTCLQLE